MKRPSNGVARIDLEGGRDPKANLSTEQLAAFAVAVLTFNLLEDAHVEVFSLISMRPGRGHEASKLNHIDAKTEFMLREVENIGLDPDDLRQFREMLARFNVLKDHRNAMVHCRLINAPVGIGMKDDIKGSVEILLTAEAMEAFRIHMWWLEQEFSGASSVIAETSYISRLEADDSELPKRRTYLEAYQYTFHEAGDMRIKMLPLPDFPTEAEMEKELSNWRDARQIKLSEWFSQFKGPLYRATFLEQGTKSASVEIKN
jgi:hypothetical protein